MSMRLLGVALAVSLIVCGVACEKQKPGDEESSAGHEPTSSVPEPQEPVDWIAKGRSAYDTGDFVTALEAFSKAVDAVDAGAEAHYWKAAALRKRERYDESLAAATEALQLDPDYAPAHANIGNIYYRTGKPEAGIEKLRLAISLDPDYAEAHLTLGVVLHSLNRHDESRQEYERTLELEPENALAHHNLGIIEALSGQKQKAIERYQRAVELDPAYVTAYSALGELYLDSQEHDKAIEVLREAVRIEPEFGRAHELLSYAYFMKKQPAEAWAHVRRAKELDIQYEEVLLEALAEEMPDPAPSAPDDADGTSSDIDLGESPGSTDSRG